MLLRNLRNRYGCSDILQEKMKLELHPDKSKIFPIYHGTTFLGFRVFYYHRLLKKSNIKHFRRRLEGFRVMKENKLILDEKIQESINGWMAYAEWGNTYKPCFHQFSTGGTGC